MTCTYNQQESIPNVFCNLPCLAVCQCGIVVAMRNDGTSDFAVTYLQHNSDMNGGCWILLQVLSLSKMVQTGPRS